MQTHNFKSHKKIQIKLVDELNELKSNIYK